jgi:flagellar protein FlgJ
MAAVNTLPDTSTVVSQALQAAQRPMATRDPAKVKQAAQGFEAMFLSQMIGEMFAGVKTDGLFGGGHGEQTFRSLMFDEYGKILARAGGVGLASSIEREMLKAQEGKK